MEISTAIKNLLLLNVLDVDYSFSVYAQGEESLELISSTSNSLGVINIREKRQEKKKEVMLPIELLGKVIGALQVKIPHKHELSKKECLKLDELTKQLAPILRNGLDPRELQYNTEVLKWIYEAKRKFSKVSDWIGIYYKTEYISGVKSEDLILGPYIGESTDHVKIRLSEGLCGLALREDRVVNIDDVQSDERHIACSLKTKSELIIPLRNSFGDSIAELDIDSNRLSAFTEDIEKEIKDYCLTFPLK